MNKQRNIVLPGHVVGDARSIAGPGTARVGDKLVALTPGLLQAQGEKMSVIPLKGRYEPRAGDLVIGVVTEANPGNWIIDIGGPYPAPLHVSEAPWRVDFGETLQYLRPGDAILCKVLFVDESKKNQVTLKDRNLTKLEGGELLEIAPVKVARLIGKSGSMLNLLKEYIECWLSVGQNGRVWVNGDPAEVLLAKEAIQLISKEGHRDGLTERVRAFLETRKPGGIDAGLKAERRAARAAAEASGEEEVPTRGPGRKSDTRDASATHDARGTPKQAEKAGRGASKSPADGKRDKTAAKGRGKGRRGAKKEEE